MTLISITSNFGQPIIVGDILTSSEDNSRKVEIPIFLEDVKDKLPVGQKWLPYGLVQKIYIINEQIAVALAGSTYEMKFLLEELRNYFKYKEATFGNLSEFFNEYDFSSHFNESTLFLLFADKTGDNVLFHQFRVGTWKVGASSLFENVLACGTGSDFFIEKANGEGTYFNGSALHPLHRALSLNYLLLSRILLHERATLDTIMTNWGAGFELIYYDGEKFVKMDDVTYVVWTGKIGLETNNYQVSVAVALNFKYHGELLSITVSTPQNIKGYGVLPLGMSKDDIAVTQVPNEPHLNGDKICHIYLLDSPDGKTHSISFFTLKSNQSVSVIAGSGSNLEKQLGGLFYNKEIDIDSLGITFLINANRQFAYWVNKEMQDGMMEQARKLFFGEGGTDSEPGIN